MSGRAGTRCPDCGEAFSGRPERCPACGLPLVGMTAARLWVVDQHIASLVVERVELLRVLRAGVGASGIRGAAPGLGEADAAGAGAGASGVRGAETGAGDIGAAGLGRAAFAASVGEGAGAFAADAGWIGAGRPVGFGGGASRPEWTRRRVQNLLLSLGVLLLAVAALIFVAVNWGTLGVGGRAAAMALVTVAAGAAASAAARRALPATAESVAALTIALLIVDAVGLRLTGFAADVSAAVFAGVVAAVIGLLTAAWSRFIGLRTLRISMLISAQLVIPLVTGTTTTHPAGVAAVYTLQTAALLAIRFRLATSHVEAIRILRVSAYVWWGFALIASTAALYGRSVERSPWGFAEFAALAVLAVWAARHEHAELHLAAATATAVAAFCGIAPHLAADWRAPAVAGVALLAAAAVQFAIPARLARASTGVVAATALGALLPAAKPIAEALTAPFAVTDAWHADWSHVSRLAAADTLPRAERWSGSGHLALLVAAALATAALLSARATGPTRQAAGPTLAALGVANLVLVPFEAAWTVPVAVAWDLTLGAALLIAAAAATTASTRASIRAPRPQRNSVLTLRVAAGIAAGFLVHGAMWSLRSATLTVLAVGALVVATGVAAVAARSRDRLVLATSAAALVALEAGLMARYQGASIAATGVVLAATAAALLVAAYVAKDSDLVAAVRVVALAAGAVGLAMSAAEPVASAVGLAVLIAALAPLAPAWLVIVQVLLCLEADAIHRCVAPHADLSSRALVVAVAAAGVSVVASRLPARVALITGPSVYGLALLGTIAGRQPDPIWIILLVGGVAAAGVAMGYRPRGVPAAVSAALVLAAAWVRLGEAHVHAVEPYTLPAATVLLVAGYTYRRESSSWSCYAPGLLAGLVPALVQALADPGLTRPAFVGLAALATLAAGVRGRLQAPLAIGAGALATIAVAQLSPYLADAYNAVPRWSLIAAAGALLLAVGVTYERRIRDLRSLGRRFGGLR